MSQQRQDPHPVLSAPRVCRAPVIAVGSQRRSSVRCASCPAAPTLWSAPRAITSSGAGKSLHSSQRQATDRKEGPHESWPDATYLAPISLRLTTLRTWRDLQRFLAAYPDPAKSWRGHLWVQEIVPSPKTPREGIVLEVTQYEDPPNDDLPLKVFVRLEYGEEVELEVRHMQAIEVVW